MIGFQLPISSKAFNLKYTGKKHQVEILEKYNQLDYVLAQLSETTKKPRAGTSPLVAVPLRLDLTPEQVDKILG